MPCFNSSIHRHKLVGFHNRVQFNDYHSELRGIAMWSAQLLGTAKDQEVDRRKDTRLKEILIGV